MDGAKRIITNVGILYVRMAFISVAKLYASRVILEYLGIDSFGVYVLIFGFITTTAFLQSSMAISVQRNISYEMGAGTKKSVQETFAASYIIYVALCAIIFLIASTIGYYLFVKYINIPDNLIFSSRILYFTTLLTVITQILCIPCSASFIAHENLFFTSVIEIAGSILNLVAIFSLALFDPDFRLIYYGIATLFIGIITLAYYIISARRKYEECRFSIPRDKQKYKRILTHAFWNVIPSISTVLKLQGSSILLNLFFGTVANSAYGIASQVNAALSQFMYTIANATNPQILLKYAAKKISEINVLIQWAVKMIFFILFTISMPLLFETDYIFSIWLVVQPEHAQVMARIFIVIVFVDSLSNPLMTLMQATGKIGYYSTIIAFIQFMILPVAYVAYKYFDAPVESLLYVSIGSSVCAFVVRVIFANRLAGFNFKSYLSNVLLRIFVVLGICLPIFHFINTHLQAGFARFAITAVASVGLATIMLFTVLLTAEDRVKTKALFHNIMQKLGLRSKA